MTTKSTTYLRELAMQLSRLRDQTIAEGITFAPIADHLTGTINAVDSLTNAVEAGESKG